MFCKIIVPVPIDKEYTYRYSKNLILKRGDVVKVPFGKRKSEIGLVYEVIQENELNYPLKNIKEIINKINNIQINDRMMQFIDWVSKYNLCPKGLILKMVLPNLEIINYENNSKQKVITKFKKNIKLNIEQKKAFELIQKNLKDKQKTIVLEGVTGSGKTEVFFEVIKKIIKKNFQVLILLPEISLTPNIEKRFTNRIGFNPEIWHSKISISKKRKIWNGCYLGEVKIVVGARSSLFLPFKNLGLIIVDEEHDISYKQEDGVRYQARDMAVVRSNMEKIPIILSSATPSIETYLNIKKKRYEHIFLSKQYSGFDLPRTHLINLQKEKLSKNRWISDRIINGITNCLNNNKQSLIFLNRRGYAPLTICSSCGYRIQCEYCSSWLVMHNKKRILCCHHCGFTKSLLDKCLKCNSENSLKFIGPGIERIAEELKDNFPKANIEILSSENMNTHKKISEIINRIEQKKIDIMVGTQILAKGHHFPNLSLVGVIDADAGLMGGDLRASEHTYNLLQQVSGRAGRSIEVGDVYIQTYFENNPLIQSLKKHDRESFLKYTLNDRKNFNLPPYVHLISLIFSGFSKGEVFSYSKKTIKKFPIKEDISILGPVEAPIFLLRGRYRYRVLLRGSKRKELNLYVEKWLKNITLPHSIRLITDVNPYTFM